MHATANPLWTDSVTTTTPFRTTTGLLLFATYFTLSVLGDLFLVHGSTASPFWPAAGFGLIATVIYGKGALLPIFFGSQLSVLLSAESWSASSLELFIRCIGFPVRIRPKHF